VAKLAEKGFKIDPNPGTKLTPEQYDILAKEFKTSALDKKEAHNMSSKKLADNVLIDTNSVSNKKVQDTEEEFYVPTPVKDTVVKKEEPVIMQPVAEVKTPVVETKATIPGLKILGKIDLDAKKTVTDTQKTIKQEKLPVVEEVKPVVIEKTSIPEEKFITPVKEEKKEEVALPELKKEEVKIPEEKKIVEPVVENKVQEVEKIQDKKVETDLTGVESQNNKNVLTPHNQEKQQPQNVKQEVKKVEVTEQVAKKVPEVTEVVEESKEIELVKAKGEVLKGLTVLGKIELPVKNKTSNKPNEDNNDRKRKRKRKRLKSDKVDIPAGKENTTTTNSSNTSNTPAQKSQTTNNQQQNNNRNNNNKPGDRKPKRMLEQVSDKEIQEQIKQTLSKLTNKGSGNKPKKYQKSNRQEERDNATEDTGKMLRVTEFISANDLAVLMDISVNQVISTCLNMGMFVSINQRLDAEAIRFIAYEFGYEVDFITPEAETETGLIEEEDSAEDLNERAPIVTIMGHVDHGKTSLLDYIRSTKVAAGEAGGITQHIGAYSVKTDDGRPITFLDTPGHEAFTAMRARGAKITDVVIIVVAADDNVMPQTKEAINHAQNAGVPIVIALNKIDKPGANPEKIKKELAEINILVEDWGGKYQCQEISAKTGQGIPELLEKVLLEAELLELKANPDKRAVGAVIEASLDKGRGYVTTLLVQAGTLKVGDIILAGSHFGRVKAMTDYRGTRLKIAGPSTPVQVLGLPGAPQAGDKFNVLENEREAREIATRREQILREQKIHTRRHLGLEEIGRRIALGSFHELNVILKGDVDGSVEALSDSLEKLSTPEVQVKIINKGVGQISEADVNLAIAADAIIVGFQVRPSLNARKLAEQEQIDIKLYSIIYDAINDVRDAMEGKLAPTFEEVIVANVEVREVFKISKVGTVAGCYVLDGNLKRNNKVKIYRNDVLIHTGEIDALKRFKDDVNEVKFGYECGLSIRSFNDIEVGDMIESFEMKEIKRTL
jgi:translation initiation factor IF-2